MDDFIPKEELAKFMAKCGDKQLQQQVRAEAYSSTHHAACMQQCSRVTAHKYAI